MAWTKPSVNLTRLFIVLSVELVVITSFSTQVHSQVSSIGGWVNQSVEWVNRRIGRAPKVRPAPVAKRPTKQQARAGARGTYSQGKKPLTALVPANEVALTVAKHPTFFFYVPQTPTQAEFVLWDENNDVFYKSTFTVTGSPGIVSLNLPADRPPLEVGKEYHWKFSMILNPQKRSIDLAVEGWTQRIEPSQTLVNELEKATPQAAPAIYAAAGIWHETLTSLAELRRSSANDSMLVNDWAALLESIEIDEIAQEPLVQCCTVRMTRG